MSKYLPGLASFLILYCFSSQHTFAQTNAPGFCAEEQMLARLLANNPQMLARQLDIENQIYSDTKNGRNSHDSRSGGVLYTLPVVVHIIQNGGPENISDAQVLQGIEDMNEAYANIGYYDSLTGVDVQVQFCLAKRGPNGNLTTGITRDTSALTSVDIDNTDLQMKNLDRWNPDCYANIWLVKEICESGNCSSIAGYAYLPSAAGTNLDGIVCVSAYFGSSKSNSIVQIHEMGHYLGLYHVFQGGCTNNNCLLDGDKVCDTPPINSTDYYECGAVVNTCSTDTLSGFTTDQPDLYQDYMDYGNWNCMNVFTQGQKDRMLWTIQNVRSGMLGCKSCVDPCSNPTAASFTVNTDTVFTGGSVNFTNTSTNSTSYNWYLNGNQFSTSTNTTNTFNSIGSFLVTLQANNADSNCYTQFSDTITVICPVVAGFNQSAYQLLPGQADTFTNTSLNASAYQWFVDGVMQATTLNFNYTFTTAGDHYVYLVASNGTCSDTTQILNFVHVGVPCKPSFTWSPANPNTCSATYFIPDTNCHYSNYYWSFCEQDTLGNPVDTQYSTTPVGSSDPNGGTLFKDNDGNYHVFFTDYNNTGTNNRFYRMDFGNSISNTPVMQGINISGLGDYDNHSIYIVEDNGTYYAFLLTFHLLYRAKIGPDIMNNTWVADTVDNMSGYVSWGDKVEIIKEANNYWALIANRGAGNYGFMTVAFIGNNIESNPSQVLKWSTNNLGEDSYFGMDYVIDNGNHYIFGTDYVNGLKRFDFGNSLANTPVITNLGYFSPTYGSGSYLNDISLFRNCDGSFDGVLIKENLPDHKILHLDSITATPVITGTLPANLPRLGGMSPFLLTDLGITTFMSEPYYYNIARLSFGGTCTATNAFSNNEFPAPISYTTAGSHYVRLIVDQGLPTQATYCQDINVTNLNSPPLNLGPDIVACAFTPVVLHAGPLFASYLWSTGYTDSTFTAYLPGEYWVQVTDFCGNVFRDSINIAIDSSAVFTLNDTSICGTNVLLTGPVGFSNYSWSPASNLACPSCRSTTGTVNSTTVFSLQATNNGCTTIGTEKVNIGDTTAVNIQANQNPICANDSVQICAPAGFSNYTWNTGANIQCIYASYAGDYYVDVSDSSSGCHSESNHIPLAVFPVPSVSIVVNGDTLLSYGAVKYQWIRNNELISGATGNVYIALQPGSYQVQVTDTNGCNTTSNPVIISANGIPDVSDEQLAVYPNPSHNSQWILYSGAKWEGSQLEVYDIEGRKIYSQVVTQSITEIKPGQLPAAVYTLRITNQQYQVSRKLVNW